MTEGEFREYKLSGEVSPEDWDLILSLLGRLGVAVTDATGNSTDESGTAFDDAQSDEPEQFLERRIPYSVSEITSPLQFLSNEHIGEFWPVYRNAVKEAYGRNPNKANAIIWGINLLANPRKRGRENRNQEPNQELRDSLGLIVQPRVSAGFPGELQGRAYGLWNHPDFPGVVIQVGSFIDAIRHISELPASQRPYRIDAPETRFFLALAATLEAQILAADIQETI